MSDEEKFGCMLSLEEVLQKVPFSVKTLRRLIRKGLFPKSVWISPGRQVWRESDLLDWQRNLPDDSRYHRDTKGHHGTPRDKPKRRLT